MSSDDTSSASSYAPKSPDLSSLVAAAHAQTASQLHHPHLPPSHAHQLPPAPAPPCSAQNPAADFHPSFAAAARGYAPPSSLPPAAASNQQHYVPPTGQQSTSPSQAAPYGQQPWALLHQHPRPPARPAYVQAQTGVSAGQPYPPAEPHAQRPTATAPEQPPPLEMPPRKHAAAAPAPAVEPSPVRTKFPTARIKRIMQADEEVGKVAQQTPIAVGKALELFMVQLVSRSADVAKDKGSKRVTAPMLKQVVEMDDQWDFLREIVGRVESEKEGSSRAKAKAESESEDEPEPEPKKRGRGAGRRKKA